MNLEDGTPYTPLLERKKQVRCCDPREKPLGTHAAAGIITTGATILVVHALPVSPAAQTFL